TLKDTFLRALLDVYNAVQLPEAYRVSREGFIHDFDFYPVPIHDHIHPFFDKIWINVDTNIEWEKRLSFRLTPTGNESIDSLIQIFGITVDSVIYEGRFAT